jgi:multiple sugar transport system substrate-binding protein/putative aldouronate transport system substrate-binding protein
VRTAIGEYALMDNLPVPEEFGGGLYADGMLQINQWMLGSTATNPLTGYSYVGTNAGTWPAEIEKAKTTTLVEWSERFDATGPVDYLVKNDLIGVVPFVNVNLAPDTTDISLIRTSCGPLVCDASWKMIFAQDQAEFDALWAQLKTDLEGFGWNDLVQYDIEKYQVLVDERARASAE